MGKTRLLGELVAEAGKLGFTTYAADCPALGREASYTVWAPIARAFFGVPAGASPAVALAAVEQRLPANDAGLRRRAPLLGALLGIPLEDNDLTRGLDAKVRRSSLEGLVIECIRHRARSGPLLIVLEECHWIDEASRHLLRAVVNALARFRVAILLAHRPVRAGEILGAEEAAHDFCTTITLGDLEPADARRLVAARLAEAFGHHAVPEPLIDLVASRAAGNPFFIEEVAKLLQAQAEATSGAPQLANLELPESLHSLVLGRIDQLGEDAQSTLKVASVIGRLFPTAVLFGVHPVEHARLQLPAQLAEMTERDLVQVEPGGTEESYLFRHVVIQEVAYESLPFGFRASIHEAIGAHLEARAAGEERRWVDLLAFHYGRGRRDDKKRQYLTLAGDCARAAYALESAISYYERVLPLLEGPARVEVLARLGEALELAGRWDDAFARYREAREGAEAAGQAARRAAMAGAIGDLHRKRGEFIAAETWISRAREENTALGDEGAVAHMLHLEATLYAQTGSFGRATDLYRKALEIRTRLGDEANAAKTLNNLGIVARSQGDVATALGHYEQSLAMRRRVGDRREIANSLNNLGFVHRVRREYERARALLEESVQVNRSVGDRWATANALTSLAELALDTNDAALAQRCLAESIAINRELGDRRALAFLLEAFGRLAMLRLDPAGALFYFTAASTLRVSIGAPLEPADAEALAGAVAHAASSLPPEERARQEEAGRRLPLGEVLDRATATGGGDASSSASSPPFPDKTPGPVKS